MRLAIAEAKEALKEDELPVGAVVVMDGEVVGSGRRFSAGNTRLDHAEMRALRTALDKHHKHSSKMTVYTTLEPCVMCFGTILNSKIGRVVYALRDPYGGATHFHPNHMPERHKMDFPEIVGGIMEGEVKEIFKNFFLNTKNDFWKNHPENPLVSQCMDKV